MLVTKHAAELCALLVNDLYGELPSRILVTLLNKGRSTITQLIQHTSLTPRHLRNGLGVLFQQNLLYTRTDPDSKITTYEANPDACYNLVRSGKILDVIDRQFGPSERDLVQTLLHLGHARIHDLTEAFTSRAHKANGNSNGFGAIEGGNHFQHVLARLIQAEIIDTVRQDTFRNPGEVYQEIKDDVTKTAPGERTSSRDKDEHNERIADRYRSHRDQSKALKRQLDMSRGSNPKRRRLQNGRATKGDPFDDNEENAPQFNPNIIVRVNHERCLVELRNQRLADFAAEILGENTGEVYRALLDLLTAKMSRCREDPSLSGQVVAPSAPVTTLDIFDHLGEDVNVYRGIGKAPKEKIDSSSSEKVKINAPQSDDESDDDWGGTARRAGASSLNTPEEDDDDDGSEDDSPKRKSAMKTNGEKTKVKFDEEPKTSRLDEMRQHLLLLKESPYKFIRHCGTQGRGQWTVDFNQLLGRLREAELDAVIEQSHGRHGLRLTRILREKGKLDEKMLHSAALMKKGDVQGKMLALQMAGLVDIQEVPKDGTRLANRTLFFWFFDGERTQAQVLDDVYKAMMRCLQTLQVERYKERNILSFVDRKDVQGKEEEVMTAEHYNKYNNHLQKQEMLLGQVMRLDDMISVLRDF